MDVYSEITKRVDAYYVHLKKTNTFYQAIFSGTLTAEALGIYLQDISVSLRSTIKQCTIGAKASRLTQATKLQEFFEHKISEETGHDQWALDDLDRLATSFAFKGALPEISKEMQDLVAYNTALASKRPSLYLVYMLFAEYFTVLAAPEVLAAIENKCGIPQSMVSVLSKHAELDRDHVEEWRETVKDCEVDMVALFPEALVVLQEVMDNYDTFWNYVGACNKRYAKQAA